MTVTSKNPETNSNMPDPEQLFSDLKTLETDQKKWNHLRDLFLEEADLDGFLLQLDTDEEIDLTRKQITNLKATLEGYRVYLKEYLQKTGERIGRFDEKLKKSGKEIVDPDLTPEAVDKIAHTRKRVAQAMQIAKKPRGAKGKSLREVTQKGAVSEAESKKELTSEEIEKYLGEFKTRFDALPELHKGVQWADVETSLKADLESMRKLKELDAVGFEMNVFRAKYDSEIQFRTAQTDVFKIAPEYRTIMYDKKAQTDYPEDSAKGNAEDIAKSMGVELADRELYEQLCVQNGWVWLETATASRKYGEALYGGNVGVDQVRANLHTDRVSFCAALRVKKA